jgi:thiol-disulfide isomerase/thioredoxin
MKNSILALLAAAGLAGNVFADGERLPMLKVGSEVYSNVVVTSVTGTDIYFSHSRGIGNAKLKNLEPNMQKMFHYDSAKASDLEKQQADSNARYAQAALEAVGAAPKTNAQEKAEPSTTEPIKQPSGPRSFLNKPSPTIAVQKWLPETPDLTNKFVLVHFWATWCAPCKKSIPALNALSEKFKDKLLVVGLTDEDEETVSKMTDPKIDYLIAIDTEHRSLSAAGITSIPYTLLIDPKGIVRYEGHPDNLDENVVQELISKNSEGSNP